MPRRKQLKGVADMLIQWCLSRNFDHNGYWAPGQIYALTKSHRCTEYTLVIVDDYAEVPRGEAQFPQATELLMNLFKNNLQALGLPLSWIKAAEITFSFDVNFERRMHLWRSELGGQPAMFRVKITTDLGRKFTREGGCNVWVHNPVREQRRSMSKNTSFPP